MKATLQEPMAEVIPLRPASPLDGVLASYMIDPTRRAWWRAQALAAFGDDAPGLDNFLSKLLPRKKDPTP